MMSEIVEVMAMAICDRATGKNHWDRFNDVAKGFFRKEARAAIAALRASTPETQKAPPAG